MSSNSVSTTPLVPPFTAETAARKVRMAENAWNSRDPERVSHRNRLLVPSLCWRPEWIATPRCRPPIIIRLSIGSAGLEKRWRPAGGHGCAEHRMPACGRRA